MKYLLILLLGFSFQPAIAQDYSTLLKQAQNLERQVKEPEALAKYKQLAETYPNDVTAAVKSAQFLVSAGGRLTDKKAKLNTYTEAKTFADKAWQLDSNSAEVNYTRALICHAMTEVEQEKKKVAEWVRQMHLYAGRALSINANHGKANYLMGKWHAQVSDLSWGQRTAIKTFMGGLPKASVDSAINYMEKCRSLEPYYVLNFYDLAKIYKKEFKPANALEVLNKLVKLPVRTADDEAMKEEGRKILQEMK